jgi:hypothetical protein
MHIICIQTLSNSQTLMEAELKFAIHIAVVDEQRCDRVILSLDSCTYKNGE